MKHGRLAHVLIAAGFLLPISTAKAETIDGAFDHVGALEAGTAFNLTIAGRGGVPSSGAGSVALNVTAVNPSQAGFLTVWPTGQPQPNASNLNFTQGQTIPNMVIVPLGTNGQISLRSETGTVNVLVDVLGWFPTNNSFTGLTPARLMDTRVPPPPPPPPAKPFSAGTHLVGSDMPPGRYVAEGSAAGCYWERLSGLGGTFDEILANDFVGDTGRVIVDLRPADIAFKFTSKCGTFAPYAVPGTSPSTTIPAGSHLVGVHISSGTYTTLAADGCYWERVSSFDGELDSIIANDFVGAGGQQYVTVSAGDVGFTSNAKCGQWQLS